MPLSLPSSYVPPVVGACRVPAEVSTGSTSTSVWHNISQFFTTPLAANVFIAGELVTNVGELWEVQTSGSESSGIGTTAGLELAFWPIDSGVLGADGTQILVKIATMRWGDLAGTSMLAGAANRRWRLMGRYTSAPTSPTVTKHSTIVARRIL